jgi:hypothetical protein
LKGPVHSAYEKINIAKKATMVAGSGNVDDQLDVMPSK